MDKGFELKITVSEEFADLVAQKMSDNLKQGNEVNKVMYYSIPDVAKLLQTTDATIQRHIRQGLLQANKPGKNYIITQKQLDDYVNTNQ